MRLRSASPQWSDETEPCQPGERPLREVRKKAITKGKPQHMVLPSIPEEGTDAWNEADEATQHGRGRYYPGRLERGKGRARRAHPADVGANRTGLTSCKTKVSIDGNTMTPSTSPTLRS